MCSSRYFAHRGAALFIEELEGRALCCLIPSVGVDWVGGVRHIPEFTRYVDQV